MADEDRSAAPDDDRPEAQEAGSDWFFRDHFARPAETGAPGVGPAATHADLSRGAGSETGHLDAASQPTPPRTAGAARSASDPSASGHQPASDETGSPGPSYGPGPGLGDSAYYGPFGQGPAADEPTQQLPRYDGGIGYQPGPAAYPGPAAHPGPQGFAPPSSQPTASYPPPGTQPLTAAISVAGPAPQAPSGAERSARKRPRTGLVLLLAAVIAALIGSGAGYAGSRLAQSGAPAPAATAPAPQPSQSASPGGQSTPAAAPAGQMDTVQVASAALPSTVMIRVGSGGSGDTGSGFVLDTAGHIMTNNHVIAGAADGGRITVLFSDGARVGAELVGRSPSYDVAVIKITDDHELTPMPIGDSDDVQVGESVVAIGSPLALASTVTQGIVSAKNRPVVVQSAGGAADSPSAYIDGIQTDAAINPGNSGGPLVDARARVVGVNSAILTMGQNRDASGNIGLGFAIPINQAMQIGAELIKNGKATYPVIGVNVDSTDDGVRLSQVDADGPAAKAELQVDDVITEIDDQPVSTPEELIVAIRTHRPGDRVTLTYERGGQQGSAEVTLGSREG